MSRSESFNKAVVLAIGLLVLLAPVVIILLTVSFLQLTGDLALGGVSLLEFLELYVIDLIVFAAFAYGLYRLTLTLVERQLPVSLDAIEPSDPEDETVEASDDGE